MTLKDFIETMKKLICDEFTELSISGYPPFWKNNLHFAISLFAFDSCMLSFMIIADLSSYESQDLWKEGMFVEVPDSDDELVDEENPDKGEAPPMTPLHALWRGRYVSLEHRTRTRQKRMRKRPTLMLVLPPPLLSSAIVRRALSGQI
jgi:hypothetical protein